MKKNNINLSSLFQLFMVILLIVLGTTQLNAQLKVGNNPKTINPNALFEMESISKGMLMPRLALVHPDSFTPMTAHIKGMIVFNTDSTSNVTPGLYYNSGTKWLRIPSAVVVNNGLTLANDTLQLGGTISKPTNINGLTDTNKIKIKGLGNNMFSINDSTFSVNGTKNNIGIGTSLPDSSSILDLSSTIKGFLPPRMTNDQFKAIPNPINGLTVFNTTFNCLAYYSDGSYTCAHYKPVSVAPTAPLGNSYSAHFNGCDSAGNLLHSIAQPFTAASYTSGDSFSLNTTCQNKPISAQGCGGLTQVTGASGTVYPLININGQCWIQTNLKEIPNHYSHYTPTSWLNTTVTDKGYWGFYNVAVPNGTAGFALVEPVPGEGYLYQWSAAMDNSIGERSRGVCPTGFHIPSDCEFMYLEHGQGMSIAEQNISNNWRAVSSNTQGTPGLKLRGQGSGFTNASGWSGLLAGHRNITGLFYGRGWDGGRWWTSSSTGANTATLREMYAASRGVRRINSNNKAGGVSVRCLKD